MKNYYDILEVSRKASKDTINKVFKMHMKANHPDLFQGEEKKKAEEKSKEFTEAYNVLSDDAQRAKYDEELNAQENSNSNQLQTILQENEYLKRVIAQKDEYITRLTGEAFETDSYNTQNNYYNQFQQPNNYQQQQYHQNAGGYGGFNGFTPPQSNNPYEGMSLEELKKLKKEQTKEYYKAIFKEQGIKLIIFILVIIVFLISIISSFNDMSELLGR